MAVTRDQARRLLTDSEMGLFGDSRNPALRALTEKQLGSRVERTRKLRDKSRDLLQRQKLKSRERTGSKRGTSGSANERTQKKGEVLDDILQRFEGRLEEVRSPEKDASRSGGKKTAGSAAALSAPSKKTTTGKAAGPARTSGAKTSRAPTAKKAAASAGKSNGQGGEGAKAEKSGARAARGRKSGITPERALAQTRELLDAKQQREREPAPYQERQGDGGEAGVRFQSGAAKARALELHAGEIRQDAVHGSISTRDRHNQRKRDSH